jgi:hypothetical protein
MATLNIGGRRVKVDDSFLKLSPEQQSATVDEIAASLGIKPEAAPEAAAAPADELPVTANRVVRSAATGVPIIGGVLNKLNAATNATLAPVVEPFLGRGPETLDQPTWGERYAKSLGLQDVEDKRFAEESPVIDTTAKVAGGVGGILAPILRVPGAARALGASGTLPQMVKAGGVSGAAIGAADAAVRGEEVLPAAAIGGGLGVAAPLVGQAVGAGVRALRGQPAPVQQRTMPVGGVEVPVSQGQATGDLTAAGAEQRLLATQQPEAVAWKEAQDAAMRQAQGNIGASLDPTGASAGLGAQDAGERVLNEAIDLEAQRLATETARRARIGLDEQNLRVQAGQVDPAMPPAVLADSPYAAAEQVGAGVAGRAGAHRAQTRSLYDQANNTPAALDPGVREELTSEAMRRRIGVGDEAVFVDPQTASKANEALRILDDVPGGIFSNRAAPRGPVGPVAQAMEPAPRPSGPAAAAPTDAERAFAEMTAQGINPTRARAAVEKAGLEGADAIPRTALEPHSVATASGGSVDLVPKVVEARAVKTSADPDYLPDLQPRNRMRAASEVQISDMSRNLTPQRLGVSTEADRGAPIVGPDGMTESGNGRVLAIRQAYAQNGAQAQKYREWLASQGVDVSKYREPILVRERATPMSHEERRAFTVAANQSSTLSMSGAEKALADSRALTPEALGLIRDAADIGAVANRDFVRQFMQSVPASERAALMTASGDLSAEGLTRVRNAVLAKAYGNSSILARAAESTKDEIKSISSGLQAAAPEWARLRAMVAQGAVPNELDGTVHLLDAVERTARIRGRGTSLAEGLAQNDAFAAQSPESEAFMRLFYSADGKSAAPASTIGNALRDVAQQAAKVDAAPGLGLGLEPVTMRDILAVTSKKVGAPSALAKEIAENAAPPGGGTGGAPITELTLRQMDAGRKRLVELFGDARRASMAPGGSSSDARAVGRILHEFDNVILEAFEAGRFTGDGETAHRLLLEARASHAAYRNLYSSRAGKDPIGRAVEKILGRYADTAATPDEIARLSYGSWAEPGGGDTAKVQGRLRQILGETSPEWGANKQGLLSFLLDDRPGSAPLSPAAKAARIEKFLDGQKGRVLAEEMLSDAERGALRNHAQNLRTTEPVDVSKFNNVDKAWARISGREGGLPMNGDEVVDLLLKKNDKGNRNFSALLAVRMRRDLSPEGQTALRQGVWDRLTNAGEGRPAFESQALGNRIAGFLETRLAKVMYSAEERQQMSVLAKAHKQLVPPKGTTNPSGSAPMFAKIAKKAGDNLLAMLGAATSGFPGLAVGYAAQKGLAKLADRSAKREAVKLFYGNQGRAPIKASRVPIVLTQGAAPAQSGQR